MAKILLVEDDKSLREIYGVRLMAEGYTIISAGDGEEALAFAIKERPDLILSDVMMPKISGFDMLDILRSTTETKEIKVIMMTALSSEDQRARGEALGADRYLVKSQVGIEDVVRTVHDVLADGVAGSTPVAAPAPTPIAAPAPVPAAPVAYEQPPAPQLVIPTPVETTVAPAVAPITPAPVAPEPFVAPVTPAPVAAPAPVTFPQPATLPAPTAPFSSDAPASLGDRIIHPLPSADSLNQNGVADIASQMNQELNASLQSLPPAPIAAPAPIAPPAAPGTPLAPPAPQPYAQPPQPPLPPQPGV